MSYGKAVHEFKKIAKLKRKLSKEKTHSQYLDELARREFNFCWNTLTAKAKKEKQC